MVPIKHKEIAKYIFNTCNKLYKLQNSGNERNVAISNSAWPMAAIKYHITRINKSGFPCIKLEQIEEYIDSFGD